MDLTRESLLACAKRGDATAWEELDQLYRAFIYRQLMRQLREQDAEDLTQEVLASVCRKLSVFDRQRNGSFRRWLRVITANKLREFMRKGNREAIASGDGLSQLEDPESHSSKLWDREHNEWIVNRILSLVEADFSAETMSAFRGLVAGKTADDVGRELNMSPSNVYAAKARVMKRIKEEMSRGILNDLLD